MAIAANNVDELLEDMATKLTTRKTLVVIEDMQELARKIDPADVMLTVIFSQTDRDKPTYLHFLSFRRENGEIHRFTDREQAQKVDEYLLDRSKKITSPNVTVYYNFCTGGDLTPPQAGRIKRFADILSLFYSVGDAFQHIHRGTVHTKAH